MSPALGALALLCATLGGGGQADYVLRYKFAPGQVDRYRIDVRVNVDSEDQIPELSKRTIRGNGRNTYRVIKVNPDRTARLAVEVEPLVIRGSPPDSTMVPQQATITMTPLGEGPGARFVRGKTVSPRSLLVDPSALSRLGAVLPTRAVKPGDRWTSEAPNPFQPSGKVTVGNRFFATDQVRGTPTVRIHQTIAIPIGVRLVQPMGTAIVRVHGALKVNTAIQFAPSQGKILRSSSLGNGKLRLTPLDGKIGKDSVTVTLNVDAVSELVNP